MGILQSQGKVSEFYYYDVLRINKKHIIQKKTFLPEDDRF